MPMTADTSIDVTPGAILGMTAADLSRELADLAEVLIVLSNAPDTTVSAYLGIVERAMALGYLSGSAKPSQDLSRAIEAGKAAGRQQGIAAGYQKGLADGGYQRAKAEAPSVQRIIRDSQGRPTGVIEEAADGRILRKRAIQRDDHGRVIGVVDEPLS